jgi:hypothetical protein
MSLTWISSSADLLAVVHEMMRVGLPSGQQVARAMRVNVLSNATLGLSNDPGWGGEAPLWFYILKEAELPPYNTERLGQVGGRIMAEVLVGLLQRDPELLPVPRPSLETRPTHCAGHRPVHIRRSAAIRRRCLIAGAHRREPSISPGHSRAILSCFLDAPG